MPYDPEWHHRQSGRWRGHDYTGTGMYFVTICTYGRDLLFGEVAGGQMRPNALGEVVAEEWLRTADLRAEVAMDEFVVMPNHVHGVVVIIGSDPIVGAHGGAPGQTDAPLPSGRAHGAPLRRAPRSLGSLVAGFKTATTKRINALRELPGTPVWQRNYYEHVIRDDADLHRIRAYIAANPQRWSADADNPANWDRRG